MSLKILGYLDLEKHKHTKKFEKKDVAEVFNVVTMKFLKKVRLKWSQNSFIAMN